MSVSEVRNQKSVVSSQKLKLRPLRISCLLTSDSSSLPPIPQFAIRIPHSKRSAFTLVELLVVIMIVGLLAAVSIPVIAPTLDSRRLRETSRTITSYLAGARDTAMKNGRPVGVMFERYRDPKDPTNADSRFSIVLRQVEVPPPYAGDTMNSRVQIAGNPAKIIGFQLSDTGWMNSVRNGDFIRFNYQGPLFQISGPYSSSDPSQYLTTIDSSTNAWSLSTNGNVPAYLLNGTTAVPVVVPFQIIRQPVKSATQALQLPESVVIDLNYSGTSSSSGLFEPADINVNNPPTDTYPVMVMFRPDGQVGQVYESIYNGTINVPARFTPDSPIHFLLGKRERVGNLFATTAPLEEIANFRDQENLWISIHPQSGLITATEVAAVDPASSVNHLVQSRAYGEAGQAVGGR